MLVTIEKFYSTDKPMEHYDAPEGVQLDRGEYWMPRSLKVTQIKPKTNLPLPKRLIGKEVYSRPKDKIPAQGIFSRPDVTFKFEGENTEYTATPHTKEWHGRQYDYLTLTPVGGWPKEPDAKEEPAISGETEQSDIDFKPAAEEPMDKISTARLDLNSKVPTFEAFCDEWDSKMNS